MVGGVDKIPIANAFSGLVGMDFAGYGDLATFLQIQDAFSRFSVIFFRVIEERRTNGRYGERKCDLRSDGCFCDTRNYDIG